MKSLDDEDRRCRKPVAQLTDDFELTRDGTNVDPGSVEWGLNEWDGYALEEALVLAEAHDGEVVVVSIGAEESEGVIRARLAKGADRGVRITEQGLQSIDSLGAAYVLAAAIDREHADLVLLVFSQAMARPARPARPRPPTCACPTWRLCRRLQYEPDERTATVHREHEGGVVEVLRVRCPALFTIQNGINKPRHATLRAIKQATQKPLQAISLVDLGLNDECVRRATGARRLRVAKPKRVAGAEMIDGTSEQIATRVAEIVREALDS